MEFDKGLGMSKKGIEKQKKERIKGILSKYASKDTIEKIFESDFKLKFNTLEKKEINYFIIHLPTEIFIENTIILEKLIDTCRQFDGITDFFSNILIVYQNIIDGLPANSRESLVDALKKDFSRYTSFIYGTEVCYVGNYGTAKKLSFGAIIPDIDKKMCKLFSLDVGQNAHG